MNVSKDCLLNRPLLPLAMLLLYLAGDPAIAAQSVAFPETFSFRLASYSVVDADTDITVLTDQGLGTGVSFADDLGGDTSVTIPRLDLYYRFNNRHRIDLSSYGIDRAGRKRLQIDVEFEDQTYSVGDTVISDISYELFKIGYIYSFYHSSVVELGVSAGVNLTSYDFNYELENGSDAGSSSASAPLPMFGLRMSYAINRKWSIHYLSETFFIELGDELEGALLNYELDLRYRLDKDFMFGLGFTRVSIDLSANDEDWKGRIVDKHRAVLLYASYYL